MLQPFQGEWKLSLSKTLANWQANGMSADEIAQARKLGATIPIHPDMLIEGTAAILHPGVVEGSYDFFALHAHPNFVCGKAWHHEDRNDPGDMEKDLVRLELRDKDLHLSLRAPQDSLSLNDPDLTNTPVTAGSAETCDADNVPESKWFPWQTFVFEPASPK
jgi:hypothetical protein